MAAQFEAQATQFVDAVVEEAEQRKLAATRAAAQAEQDRKQDAFNADLLRRARAGEVAAMLILAAGHRKGANRLPQDYAQSRFWYERASSKGSVVALGSLSWMYLDGEGVPASKARAFEYALKSASGAPLTAQDREMQVASMRLVAAAYEAGEGVAQSRANAVKWYRECARRGNERCASVLKGWGLTN